LGDQSLLRPKRLLFRHKKQLFESPNGFGMLFTPVMSSHHRPSISNLYSYLPGASSTVTFQNPSSSFFIGFSWASQLLKSPTKVTPFADGALTLKVTFLFSVCPLDTLIYREFHFEVPKRMVRNCEVDRRQVYLIFYQLKTGRQYIFRP